MNTTGGESGGGAVLPRANRPTANRPPDGSAAKLPLPVTSVLPVRRPLLSYAATTTVWFPDDPVSAMNPDGSPQAWPRQASNEPRGWPEEERTIQEGWPAFRVSSATEPVPSPTGSWQKLGSEADE